MTTELEPIHVSTCPRCGGVAQVVPGAIPETPNDVVYQHVDLRAATRAALRLDLEDALKPLQDFLTGLVRKVDRATFIAGMEALAAFETELNGGEPPNAESVARRSLA